MTWQGSISLLQKCADIHVSDKRVYYTFARTLPPSSKVSKSVVALLLYFKWTKFIIVAGKRPAWGSEVQEAMKVRLSKVSLAEECNDIVSGD